MNIGNNETKKSGDTSNWKIIYPVYLDKKRSISKGRVVSFLNCIENPTVAEIAEVCIQLGIPCQIERKRHPKDYRFFGRVRYSLLDSNGDPYNKQILSKRQLLISVGSGINEIRAKQQKTHQQIEYSNLKICNNDQSNICGSNTIVGRCKPKKKK
ncbi:signal recognition particle SPR19 [Cryptosporidium ryanae]|uniref:signal recognition particle SPR19 n=1 Tax=Cryptosporidium ryanae TaxID=515981 RepID=UPI00351A9122|nr:signal recognition particle SPR19 [Cryptosporidium ryanae]